MRNVQHSTSTMEDFPIMSHTPFSPAIIVPAVIVFFALFPALFGSGEVRKIAFGVALAALTFLVMAAVRIGLAAVADIRFIQAMNEFTAEEERRRFDG